MQKQTPSLFRSANWIMAMGIVAVLIAAQWKTAPLPMPALAIVALLALAKARLIILDFIGLRGQSPALLYPLYGFTTLMAVAALAGRALMG